MHARNLIAAAALGMVVIALVHAPAWGQKVDTPFRWGSIKKSVGEYMIDIAFNGTSVRSKLPMEFDFGLYKAAPGAPVGASPGAKVPVPDFTSVWVRVSRQKARAKFKSGFRTRAEKAASQLSGQPEILFSGTILRVDNDSAAMTYTFPETGAYELTVAFWNKDRLLVKSSLPVNVEKGEVESVSDPSFYISGVIGGLVGMMVGLGFALTPLVRRRA
jgi:hypothetical protein